MPLTQSEFDSYIRSKDSQLYQNTILEKLRQYQPVAICDATAPVNTMHVEGTEIVFERFLKKLGIKTKNEYLLQERGASGAAALEQYEALAFGTFMNPSSKKEQQEFKKLSSFKKTKVKIVIVFSYDAFAFAKEEAEKLGIETVAFIREYAEFYTMTTALYPAAIVPEKEAYWR